MSSPDGSGNPYQSPVSDAHSSGPGQPGQGSQYAPCPSCQHRGAKKVGWTFWGGALGPWLFTHVKCDACRTTFNGKTGQSNNTAIAIYLGVAVVLSLIVFGLFVCAGAMG